MTEIRPPSPSAKRFLVGKKLNVEATLVAIPHLLGDFLDFNDFLDDVDALLEEFEWTGEVQVASFHPDYQFAGTMPDDISNYTNRSPYPTLHLLREASIDRAVEAFPDADVIVERNVKTLDALGHAGWAKLFAD